MFKYFLLFVALFAVSMAAPEPEAKPQFLAAGAYPYALGYNNYLGYGNYYGNYYANAYPYGYAGYSGYYGNGPYARYIY